MFNAQIMEKHSGRQVHCSHRTEGGCSTASGIWMKKSCAAQIDAQVGPTERTVADCDQVWVFPSAVEAYKAQRENYDVECRPNVMARVAAAKARHASM